jgi:electron transport complex protein RnfD
VVAKHLYGGLGYNPFNPAMVGYVVLLISFPREMSTWLIPHGVDQQHALTLLETLRVMFHDEWPARFTVDALTGATPLDVLRTRLGLGLTVTEIRNSPVFGIVAGQGWEWAALGFLLGGLWLVYTRAADWRIPAGMLGGLAVISSVFYLIDPLRLRATVVPLCGAARRFSAHSSLPPIQ